MNHVVGLGGVGFWLAAGLVRAIPVQELTCWDADNLTGGLGHRRLPAATPDTNKTDLLRGFLLVTMGDLVPTMQTKRFTGKDVAPGDVVIDCTDMPLPRRRIMWARARKNGAKLIRISYDGKESIVTISCGLPLVGRPQGGYLEVPSFALSLAAGGVGAEVVRLWLADTNKFVETQINVREWACSKLIP